MAKKFKVCVELEFDLSMPDDFNESDVEFFIEESSSCFDNRLRELIADNLDDPCSCQYIKGCRAVELKGDEVADGV